jgi:hypothetical protein
MLKIKTGVRSLGIQPELLLAIMVARSCHPTGDVTITSLTDAAQGRSQGSRHYSGFAVDLRTNDLPTGFADKWASEIRAGLGNEYTVLFKSDHIHIQFAPTYR